MLILINIFIRLFYHRTIKVIILHHGIQKFVLKIFSQAPREGFQDLCCQG